MCWWLSAVSVLVGLTCAEETAFAVLAEPASFASEHGVLDILMIAKPKPIPSIPFTPPDGGATVNPLGWVYEICRRPASGDHCPSGAGTVADYGGVRLALQQGEVWPEPQPTFTPLPQDWIAFAQRTWREQGKTRARLRSEARPNATRSRSAAPPTLWNHFDALSGGSAQRLRAELSVVRRVRS
jgi:hypothetical protein